MTTKEQERKALEQIRKIVAGLGEDSYIGIAFEGCFEVAEENIENDFACSMKQRAEAAEKREEHHRKEANRFKDMAEESQARGRGRGKPSEDRGGLRSHAARRQRSARRRAGSPRFRA